MKLLTAVPFSLYSSTSHVRHVDLCHLFIGWRNLLCPPALIPKKLVGIPVSGTPVNYPSSFWDRSLLAMFLCFHSFCFTGKLRGCIQKFPDRLPGARTANDIALCYLVQLYRHFVGQSSEFCQHNSLCCFSTSVYCCKHTFRYRLSLETFGYNLVYFASAIVVVCLLTGIEYRSRSFSV
jgi:hypothetical protein